MSLAPAPGRTPVVAVESGASHDAWDAFLARTPGGEVTQGAPWGRVKRRAGMDVYRLVLRTDGTVVGGAQVLVRRFGRLGAVGYVPYGPIVAPQVGEDEVERLVGALVEGCGDQRIRALFVQPPEGGDRVAAGLRRAGLRPSDADVAPSASLRLDLRQDPEQLLAGMGRSVRAHVRRALRQPLEARPGTRDDLATLAALHRRTADRHGFPPTPSSHLTALWDELHGAGQVGVVIVAAGGVDVSAMLVTRLGAVATERIRGFDAERRPEKLRVNEALFWSALVQAREAGADWYDQGGLSRPLAEALAGGARRSAPEVVTSRWAHKVAFGGVPVLYPAPLELVPNPVLGWAHRTLGSSGRGARPRTALQRRLRQSSLARGQG